MRDQAYRPRKWRLASVALSGGTMAARALIDTGWKTHPMRTGIDRSLIDQFRRCVKLLLSNPALLQLIEHPILSFIQLAHHCVKLMGRELPWGVVVHHMASDDHPYGRYTPVRPYNPRSPAK